jgi:hypothetical protein
MRNAALITILLAILGGGCGGQQPMKQPVKLKGNSSLEEARAFRAFPVYYAGETVAGFPLTAVNREPVTAPPGTPVAPKLRRAGDVSSFDFAYGSCSMPSAGKGCSLPLSIQVWPACARYPALYNSNGFGGPVPKKTRIRGVPAAYFEGGYRLEIQTGASTIVIFGARSRMRAAVAALEALNMNVGPGQRLPPPPPGALDGSLACE